MEQLKTKTLLSRITGLAKANDPVYIQEVIVNAVFCNLHGNIDPMAKLIPALKGEAKSFARSHSAIKSTKSQTTGKISYNIHSEKRTNLLAKLGLDDKPSFEQVAEVVEFWKPEKSKEAQPVDAIKSAKSLLTRLNNALEKGNVVDRDSAELVAKALEAFNV